MNRQFVTVKFNPWDRKSYTYHYDAGGLRAGDEVVVETKDGMVNAIVETAGVPQPTGYSTKPILHKVER